MLHGANVDTIDNLDMLFERTANLVLSKIDVIDTERIVALAQTVHDDFYNYSLPSDYRKLIDLIPQDNRTILDTANRTTAAPFDLKKMFANKSISIESSEGTKFIRINWRSRGNKTLNTMDSLTGNGTWSAQGSATGLKANTIFKTTGSASIEFDLFATGAGIKNTTMNSVDMTNEDEVADIFVPVFFGSVANLTSVSAVWGNDVTTKFWTSTAQTTQADGTAFRVGWNIIKFPWSTATETGTVDPTAIDSFQLTVAATGVISNIRVDNIVFSIGRNFDIKYYSKYILKNSAGTWINRYTSDEDTIVLDSDAIQIWHLENLIAVAQQMENSGFDIEWARRELNGDPNATDPVQKAGLYAKYRKEHPSQAKKPIVYYGSAPDRGRFSNSFSKR